MCLCCSAHTDVYNMTIHNDRATVTVMQGSVELNKHPREADTSVLFLTQYVDRMLKINQDQLIRISCFATRHLYRCVLPQATPQASRSPLCLLPDASFCSFLKISSIAQKMGDKQCAMGENVFLGLLPPAEHPYIKHQSCDALHAGYYRQAYYMRKHLITLQIRKNTFKLNSAKIHGCGYFQCTYLICKVGAHPSSSYFPSRINLQTLLQGGIGSLYL